MLKETNKRFNDRVEKIKELLDSCEGITFQKFDDILDGMWDKFVSISAYASVK
jgi:hypothetical protein